jgi:hypothetical protein
MGIRTYKGKTSMAVGQEEKQSIQRDKVADVQRVAQTGHPPE